MRQLPETFTARGPTVLRRGSWGVCLVIAIMALLHMAHHSEAATPNEPTTGRAARAAAIRQIPFDKMDRDAHAKASSVIKRTSIFRRMPTQIVDCEARYFVFLIRHPEIIVSIWRKMGATQMNLERLGPETFRAEDGMGTVGRLEFLYGDHKTHVLYAEGSYEGSLTARPIRASCLLVLRSEYVPNEKGRYYVANRMDMFINVKNIGVELVAKTFQGVIGRATDQNFTETANFVTKLGRVTEQNGAGIQRMAMKLKGVEPGIQHEFSDIADRVYQQARARRRAAKEEGSAGTRITRASER